MLSVILHGNVSLGGFPSIPGLYRYVGEGSGGFKGYAGYAAAYPINWTAFL